ncbi:MAG: TetR/AcrR family transcriptional regulator [Candidatus Cloacimonetes bacterium]|nr:TetR/AcrR family transcriptional regulator [Candidatus Cloacimonadota bacterium]MBT4332145.1 TetR/AcrR family transcriptional regulator [Candidatus Cloacimonadota bacterium]MBT4575268.1 TetR/AcrR family transcriptional regulator [Candidatus Cloacimonadota bacterium]MBT5419295.1 TetR/AcrR family transcriptional regulator [Candidatus Cloacimonadota bacterium]
MGSNERKERERLFRQNIIISAAEKVFMSKGFENATMDDIAVEAEFSKGALYTYFQSKNELCLSIVLKGLKVITSEFEKVTSKKTLNLNKIEVLSSTFLEFHDKYPNYIFAFSNYKQHRAGCKFESPVLEFIDEENLQIREMIKQIIKDGKKDKSIRSDADSDKLSYILWGELSGLIPYFLQETENTNPVELYNYTIQLICEAIKTK